MRTKLLAELLIIALIAPATFFIAPQRASAQTFDAIGCAIKTLAAGYLANPSAVGADAASLASVTTSLVGVPVVNMTLGGILAQTAVSAKGTTGTMVSNCFDVFLKSIEQAAMHLALVTATSYIISWINGTNGTGQPSFVMNLSLNLQRLGDSVALPFIGQLRAGLNSPFGGSISSSLLRKYAQGTSVGGFFAANQSTLALVSPNPSAFLAGNFSQGGIPAWFELTTKSNNNPYLLAPEADRQLGNLVNQSVTNRRQDISQGRGFLSWCGSSNQITTTEDSDGTAMEGVNPGDSCTVDGKQGNIQTPGSVIQEYTQLVLGSDIAQLINPTDINSAVSAILQAAVNRGIKGLTTGLFGTSQGSSARPQAITNTLQAEAAANAAAAAAAAAASNASLADTAVTMAETTHSQSYVNNAQTLVNALPDGTTKTSLQARLNAVVAAIADANAAAPVIEQIAVLPATSALTLSDKPAVVAANTAFNALTASQQALVTNSALLAADVAKIVTL